MKDALKINHGNDEFFTPEYAVYPLLKYIPGDVKTIWCPCDTEDSKIVQVLQNSGYKVYCSHIDYGHDFLKYDLLHSEYDMIITNPPFSIKNKIIKRCYDLRKPFALLLPLTGLEGQARCEMYDKKGIGVVILDKRVEFGSGNVWFNTSWFIHSKMTDGRLFFEHIDKFEKEQKGQLTLF